VPNVSWDDIGGLENVKRELQEVNNLVCLDYFFSIMFPFPYQIYKSSFAIMVIADCPVSSRTS